MSKRCPCDEPPVMPAGAKARTAPSTPAGTKKRAGLGSGGKQSAQPPTSEPSTSAAPDGQNPEPSVFSPDASVELGPDEFIGEDGRRYRVVHEMRGGVLHDWSELV